VDPADEPSAVGSEEATMSGSIVSIATVVLAVPARGRGLRTIA
jgi:hypothetical protein